MSALVTPDGHVVAFETRQRRGVAVRMVVGRKVYSLEYRGVCQCGAATDWSRDSSRAKTWAVVHRAAMALEAES